MRRGASGQGGFTLLEVLVAFMVASLLLVTVMNGFSSGLASLSRTDQMARAALIAQSRLAELGVLEPLELGQYRGVVDTGDERFDWEVQVTPFDWGLVTELGSQGAMLARVEIVVRWDSGRAERDYRLLTLAFVQGKD